MSPVAGGVLPCKPSAGEASSTADAQGSSGMSPVARGVLPCKPWNATCFRRRAWPDCEGCPRARNGSGATGESSPSQPIGTSWSSSRRRWSSVTARPWRPCWKLRQAQSLGRRKRKGFCITYLNQAAQSLFGHSDGGAGGAAHRRGSRRLQRHPAGTGAGARNRPSLHQAGRKPGFRQWPGAARLFHRTAFGDGTAGGIAAPGSVPADRPRRAAGVAAGDHPQAGAGARP